MVFGFFKKDKKEEAHYDPTNITIGDLRVGFLVDYDFKTYEVKDEFEYDWGSDDLSYEFKLISADDQFHLSIDLDDDDNQILTLSRPLRVAKIEPDVKKYIMNNEDAPNQISVEGVTYYQESDDAGHYRNTKDEEFDEFLSWTFLDDSGKKTVTIEQWGEKEFEASIGDIVSEGVFTSILPGKEDQ